MLVGGHYRTFIQRDERIVEFNDSLAVQLSLEDSDALFWYNGTDINIDGHSAEDELPVLKGRRQLIYENAYMLLYIKCGATFDVGEPVDFISTELRNSIAEQNAYLHFMRPLYEYHQKLVDVTIYERPSSQYRETLEVSSSKDKDDSHITIIVPGTTSLATLLKKAVSAMYPEIEETYDISNFRLRRYNPFSDRATVTFMGKEEESLGLLGIRSRDYLCLERKLTDESFEEFVNGKEGTTLVLYIWNIPDYDHSMSSPAVTESQECLTHSHCTVQLGASDKYLVRDIRSAVIKAIESSISKNADLEHIANVHKEAIELVDSLVKVDPKYVRLISTDAIYMEEKFDFTNINSVFELNDDDEEISSESKLFGHLIIDICPTGVESQAFALLSQLKGQIRVHFKLPFDRASDFVAIDNAGESIDCFSSSVIIPSSSTVIDLKNAIFTYVSEHAAEIKGEGYVVPLEFNMDCFHLVRRDSLSQYKEDPTKSLRDLSITNNTTVMVKVGNKTIF